MFFEFSFVPIPNESSSDWIYTKHVDATSITMHILIRMHSTKVRLIRIHIIDHYNNKRNSNTIKENTQKFISILNARDAKS